LLFVESEIRAWLDGAPLELIELPRGGRELFRFFDHCAARGIDEPIEIAASRRR
jgi:hypothetical protein